MKKHAAVYGDTMGCTDISTYFWCGFVRKQYISISHINCFLYPYHSIHIPYQLFFCHIPWEKLVFETLNFQTRPAGQAEESDLLHAPGRMWCVQRRRKTGQRVNGEHVIGWSQNIYRARVDRRIELVAARLDTQILSASWRAYWMSPQPIKGGGQQQATKLSRSCEEDFLRHGKTSWLVVSNIWITLW